MQSAPLTGSMSGHPTEAVTASNAFVLSTGDGATGAGTTGLDASDPEESTGDGTTGAGTTGLDESDPEESSGPMTVVGGVSATWRPQS